MARRKASGSGPVQSAKRARISGGAEGDEEREVVMVERRTRPGEAGDHAGAVPDPDPDPDPYTEKVPLRRSNPRRAAAAAASATAAAVAASVVTQDEEIHDRAFARITADEREAWQGWTDIESEPAFFNFILGELGIRGGTIQEVFSVDEASADCLPNPGGLIFLYKFVEEDEDEVREDCPDGLWFANQTTSNACATIAMLNIAMNCPGLRLGDALTRFKADTQHLHPALRGHLLSSNAFIRSRHNSFARRLDMLTSDIALQHEWSEAEKKLKLANTRARKKSNSSSSNGNGNSNGSSKNKRKSSTAAAAAAAAAADDDDEAAFHFIAYVPMGKDVWELNGMQEKGLRLGTFTDDWTAMARERIAARMLAYAQYDDRAVFNLLALCQTGNSGPEESPSSDEPDEDVARAAARRSDYTPAVHSWIKKLADKGVLRRLAMGESEEAERGEQADDRR